MTYGYEQEGLDRYGGPMMFGVQRADTLSTTSVRVQFNLPFGEVDPEVTVPSHYAIDHGVVVHSVTIETPASVVLTTDFLGESTYTIMVSDLLSRWGDTIDPSIASADFYGYALNTGLQAVAVSTTKIRLIFSAIMSADANLLDPLNYRIVAPDGSIIPIVGVQTEGNPAAPVSVTLIPNVAILPQLLYDAQIVTMDIHTAAGGGVYPLTANFRWLPKPLIVSAKWRDFSGNGALGVGSVYFSPSLLANAPGSAIQVSWVSACALAYDEYHFRDEPEHLAFFIRGSGHASQICGGDVLFGSIGWMGRTKETIVQSLAETLLPPVSSRAIGVLREPWDPTRVAELNDITRPLFDGTVPAPFITAANLTPIPPGGTTTIILEP